VDLDDPGLLIGAKTHDPADVRPCKTKGWVVIGSGQRIHDWEVTHKLVPAPPRVEEGPFAELRLAPSPEAAVAGAIGRRRVGSEQPIWNVVRDLLASAVYAVDATGVRIKDCHADSRLIGGSLGLRKEGETARDHLMREERGLVVPGAVAGADGEDADAPLSEGWATLAAYFEETVAAVEIPSDLSAHAIKVDWCLIVSIPRVEALAAGGSLRFHYLGVRAVRLRDLLQLRDANDEFAGMRFARFLARELVRDILSPRRQRGMRDWLRLVGTTVGFAGSLASFVWLLSEVASALA
jgi:hypothetical protein